MTKNDGGPAFPADSYTPNTNGMSLRDYFAGRAMTLFPFDEEDIAMLQSGIKPQHNIVAKFCYDLANAMIEEREHHDI